MPNTFTGLIQTVYSAIDTVSRELTGMIPAVSLYPGSESVALNQTVTFPIAPAMTSDDITPATAPPAGTDQALGNDTMTITKSRAVKFYYTGDQQMSLRAGGVSGNILADQFAQAFRTLANEVESDLTALYVEASRSYGVAAVTPFATTLADTAQALKILKDNGSPMSDLQCVLNTSAGAALRTIGQLTKANEAGTDSLLRQGVLMDLHGFAIRESGQFGLHTKGTDNGAWLAAALEPVGETSIAVDTGTGTMVAGDVLLIDGFSDNYVIKTALDTGVVVIADPGLQVALPDTTAVEVAPSYTPNMFFHRNAIQLLTRPPAQPDGGDAASETFPVTDPVSGITFQVSVYKQYKQVMYEVGLAWGVKAAKPEHIGLILG